jgi:Protein of unknown function (DUF3011)
MARLSISGRRALVAGALWLSAWAQPAPARTPANPASAGPVAFSPALPGPRPVLIRCESFGLRTVSCKAASLANVKVARVLGGRCIPGLTWFYDRRSIHVRAGCRAVFVVGQPGPAAAPSR